MKKVQRIVTLGMLFGFFTLTFNIAPLDAQNSHIVIDNFQNYKSVPYERWHVRKAWRMEKMPYSQSTRVYSIRTEGGNKYLHATTANYLNEKIALLKLVNTKHAPVKWDLKTHPVLTWKWRVHKLPAGAREDNDKLNDSAASVWIVFKIRHIPMLPWDYQPIHVLQYVWSTEMPKRKVSYKSYKVMNDSIELYRGAFIALQSGGALKGRWVTERHNIKEEYRRYFRGYPRYNPIVIGIYTHSEHTDSAAIADYDDFALLPN